MANMVVVEYIGLPAFLLKKNPHPWIATLLAPINGMLLGFWFHLSGFLPCVDPHSDVLETVSPILPMPSQGTTPWSQVS